jgi:serine/threonine-protein kinase RsbW
MLRNVCDSPVTEGFTNAVRHAHHHLPAEVPIEVQMTLTSQSLIIQIWDHGSYFDLENFLQAIEGQDHQFARHRQGLPILQKIAEKLSYTRQEDNRNCLLIIKQFTTE